MNQEKKLVGIAVTVLFVTIILLLVFVFSRPVFCSAKKCCGVCVPGENNLCSLADEDMFSGSALFFEEAFVGPDRILFRIVPADSSIRTYNVSYNINTEYGSDSSGCVEMAGISAQNPIEFSVLKSSGEKVSLSVSVRDVSGNLVWKSMSSHT